MKGIKSWGTCHRDKVSSDFWSPVSTTKPLTSKNDPASGSEPTGSWSLLRSTSMLWFPVWKATITYKHLSLLTNIGYVIVVRKQLQRCLNSFVNYWKVQANHNQTLLTWQAVTSKNKWMPHLPVACSCCHLLCGWKFTVESLGSLVPPNIWQENCTLTSGLFTAVLLSWLLNTQRYTHIPLLIKRYNQLVSHQLSVQIQRWWISQQVHITN